MFTVIFHPWAVFHTPDNWDQDLTYTTHQLIRLYAPLVLHCSTTDQTTETVFNLWRPTVDISTAMT